MLFSNVKRNKSCQNSTVHLHMGLLKVRKRYMMFIFAFKTRLTSYTLLGGANKPNELNAFREMIVFMQNPMLCLDSAHLITQ